MIWNNHINLVALQMYCRPSSKFLYQYILKELGVKKTYLSF